MQRQYRLATLDNDDVPHGTGRRYQFFKCRCEECRAWRRPHARRKWLKANYGLTVEDFDNMLTAQDNKCGACGDTFVDQKSTHVDHCHSTGKIRGLLCRDCNIALGLLKDDPERIQGLKNYISQDDPDD